MKKGVQKVDISWTLPQTDYSGAAANVTGVKVYRIGTSEPIATLGSGMCRSLMKTRAQRVRDI